MKNIISAEKKEKQDELQKELDRLSDDPVAYEMTKMELAELLRQTDFERVLELTKVLFGVSFESHVIDEIIKEPKESIVKALAETSAFSNIFLIDFHKNEGDPF